MTEEVKRDLLADLTLCERATAGPWYYRVDSECDGGTFYGGNRDIIMRFGDYYGESNQSAGSPPEESDAQFIAESRLGWPHAIRRAIAAEVLVAELEREVEFLRMQRESLEFTLQHYRGYE